MPKKRKTRAEKEQAETRHLQERVEIHNSTKTLDGETACMKEIHRFCISGNRVSNPSDDSDKR